MSSPSLASRCRRSRGRRSGRARRPARAADAPGTACATGFLRVKAATVVVRGRRPSRPQARPRRADASSSSSCSSSWSSSLRAAFAAAAPNRSRLSFAISSFRCAISASAPDARASLSRSRASASSSRLLQRSIRRAGADASAPGFVRQSPIADRPWSKHATIRQPSVASLLRPESIRRTRPPGVLRDSASRSRRADRRAAPRVIATTPSAGDGQMKRPRSSRLA